MPHPNTNGDSKWEWSGEGMGICIIKKGPLDFKGFGYFSMLVFTA